MTQCQRTVGLGTFVYIEPSLEASERLGLELLRSWPSQGALDLEFPLKQVFPMVCFEKHVSVR